ncbi:MAG: MerR family DNA-binding protein [Thermodesulfobacteriota bacterium]
MAVLTSGRLAALAGVNVETIRYYERRGLLAAPARTRSGYRDYPGEAVRVVRFIKRAQGLGFTLKEVKELLALSGDSGSTCGDVRDTARRKLDDIEAKIEGLQSMRRTLKKIIKECPGKGPLSGCSILESLAED